MRIKLNPRARHALTTLTHYGMITLGALLVALATDGGDGPTDAAGAVVSTTTYQRARDLGLDVAAALARNDSYPFFDALGDLLRPGSTHTNVNDLALVVVV